MVTYTVTLYRANGRIVRRQSCRSQYAAKLVRRQWETAHDHTYYVVITC